MSEEEVIITGTVWVWLTLVAFAAVGGCGDDKVTEGETVQGITEENATNRYSAAGCPNTSAGDDANDVVYAFTPEITAYYRIALDTEYTNYDSVLYVASGCPGTGDVCIDARYDGETQCRGGVVEICEVGADSCLGWVPGTDCATDAGGPYCDDRAEPAVCVAENVPKPGQSCDDDRMAAVNLPTELPFTANGLATCGFGDNYDGETCLGNYDSGEDMIYTLNVETETSITVTLNADNTYAGIALDDSCRLDSVTCLDVDGAGSNYTVFLGCNTLPAGTYYLMVDTYAPPSCLASFELTVETCTP